MATATKTPQQIDVEIDCPAPGCEAGRIRHDHTRIDPKILDHHLKHHAYTKDEERQVIGANCDCPRVIDKPTYGECRACLGTGKRTVMLKIPRKNQEVNVIDADLLEVIFGDKVPTVPGRVYDVQMPDEHHLELKSGIGVRVTWDPLTKAGTIRKGTDVELWTFDLLELAVV